MNINDFILFIEKYGVNNETIIFVDQHIQTINRIGPGLYDCKKIDTLIKADIYAMLTDSNLKQVTDLMIEDQTILFLPMKCDKDYSNFNIFPNYKDTDWKAFIKLDPLNLLRRMITPQLKKTQKNIKGITDKVIALLKAEKIPVAVYFGNYIALKRHGTLILPWDDDVDLAIDPKNGKQVIEILSSHFEVRDKSHALLVVSKEGYAIDIFHRDVWCSDINFNDLVEINNYPVPRETPNFSKFYQGFGEDYMNFACIYNHKIFDRWDKSRNPKVILPVKRVNELLKFIN